MKILVLIIAIVLLTPMLPLPIKADTITHVRNLIIQSCAAHDQAINNRDLPGIVKILAPDFISGTLNGKHSDRSHEVTYWRQVLSIAKSLHQQTAISSMNVQDKKCIVTGDIQRHGILFDYKRKKLVTFYIHGRYQDTWIRYPSGWLLRYERPLSYSVSYK